MIRLTLRLAQEERDVGRNDDESKKDKDTDEEKVDG